MEQTKDQEKQQLIVEEKKETEVKPPVQVQEIKKKDEPVGEVSDDLDPVSEASNCVAVIEEDAKPKDDDDWEDVEEDADEMVYHSVGNSCFLGFNKRSDVKVEEYRDEKVEKLCKKLGITMGPMARVTMNIPKK